MAEIDLDKFMKEVSLLPTIYDQMKTVYVLVQSTSVEVLFRSDAYMEWLRKNKNELIASRDNPIVREWRDAQWKSPLKPQE